MHRRAHAGGRNEDVLIARRPRPLGNYKPVAVAVPDQPPDHRAARAGFGAALALALGGLGAVRDTRASGGSVIPAASYQGEMVLLQVSDFPPSRKVLERVLQLTRLARAQTQLDHQLAEPKCFLGIALENVQYLSRRGELAHQGSNNSLALVELRMIAIAGD